MGEIIKKSSALEWKPSTLVWKYRQMVFTVVMFDTK